MLHRILLVTFASLLLAACGRGSEDFTINVARPADRVEDAFDSAGVDAELSGLFSGLKVVRTKPADDAVLYTIPGDGDFPATIKLTFEPGKDGKTTIIHAAIDAPAIKVDFESKAMVLSESKVEKMVRGILRSAGKKLEDGKDIAGEQQAFSRLLTMLAIVTDSKKLKLAQDVSKYPDWYLSGLSWMSDGGGYDGPAYPYGEAAMGEDPGVAAEREESRQQSADREEQQKAEEAAEPMDDSRGDSARGDYAGSSE
jgi:hypothetical protein